MLETAIKVLEKINEAGFKSYIVGGFVRDQHLNKESADIDICTNATPKDLKMIFQNALLPKESYGGVTVIYNKIRFEITTFRKEIKYENNRIPVKIEYIDNLLEDLKRRDFTINTMCIDATGKELDLLNAKKDLDKKIIRMVGKPKYKLQEDSLRILRAVRFATILNFKIENSLKRSIKKYAYLLKNLSYYRKKEELDKIFASVNVEYGIKLLQELGLSEPLELSNLSKVKPTKTLLGIWAQLDVVDIYNFTNNEKDLINKINQMRKLDYLSNENLYHFGPYVASVVAEIKGDDIKLVAQKYESLPIQNRLDIKVSVDEICNILNKPKGGFLKPLLNDLEQKILNEEVLNEEESIINYITKTYKENELEHTN